MIAAVGRFPAEKLLEGLLSMAQDRNGLHELNEGKQGQFRHDDGWGLVYREGRGLKRYRSTAPCWADPELERFLDKELVLLHARRASPGSSVTLENAHPFYYHCCGQEWFFCHNGTVREPLPRFEGLEGTTDSERLFRMLLASYDEREDLESLQQVLDNLQDYSALNVFLLGGRYLYLFNLHREHPRYYTLHLYRDDRGLLISSEPLPGFSGWEALENGTILRMELGTGKVHLERSKLA
jgi:predicted glutamine amidotransferase